MADPTTYEEASNQVAAANQAGFNASKVTGVPFERGTIDTYFPNFNKNKATTTESSAPEYYPRTNTAEKTLAEPMEAESLDTIQARKRADAQAEIDAINRVYESQLADQRKINQGQERQTSSVNTLTGLAGSTEANRTTNQTKEMGAKQLEAIRAEQAAMVASILSDAKSDAVEEAQIQRTEARQSAIDTLALRETQAAQAITDVGVLAANGTTIEGLKSTDPEAYEAFVRKIGSEQLVAGYMTLNRPKESVLDTKIEGGKYVIAYENPVTGAVRVESVDLGIPAGYSKTIDAGNRILAIPDDWNGNPDELITINKGLTPDQAADNSRTSEVTGNIEEDVGSIMAGTLNLPDVSQADNYRAKVARRLTEEFEKAKEAGDVRGVMKASAAYDKEPSDSFITSFEKVATTLNQIGALQENLTRGFEEGKVEGIKTGPLVGAFKAKNPWSTEGQVIKAQLNAIVPNLARGVYGEVGVLTDNDIKTYAQTIPNLSSPEDVRNAVLYITVDMIKKNVETKIKTQAAGQRDMSGYAGIYDQIEEQAENILSSIDSGVFSENDQPEIYETEDGTQYQLGEDGLYYPI